MYNKFYNTSLSILCVIFRSYFILRHNILYANNDCKLRTGCSKEGYTDYVGKADDTYREVNCKAKKEVHLILEEVY